STFNKRSRSVRCLVANEGQYVLVYALVPGRDRCRPGVSVHFLRWDSELHLITIVYSLMSRKMPFVAVVWSEGQLTPAQNSNRGTQTKNATSLCLRLR